MSELHHDEVSALLVYYVRDQQDELRVLSVSWFLYVAHWPSPDLI